MLSPTWSPLELVQGLGRCGRLTSLSDTLQFLLFYAGTIEEKVAHKASKGLKCLKKVVRSKESWEDMIVNPDKYDEKEVEEVPSDRPFRDKPLNNEEPDDPDDDVFLGGDIEDE